MAGQPSNFQASAPPSSCELTSPVKLWAPTEFLSSGWHISLNCLACPLVSRLWALYVRNEIYFSPVNLSYVN